MECAIHIVNDTENDLQTCSAVSWTKIKSCAYQWLATDSVEKKIAEQVNSMSDTAIEKILYHRKCYMRFTDKVRIAAAVKRTTKLSKTNVLPDTQNITDDEHNIPNKRFLRSKSTMKNHHEDSKSKNVLPKVCILCRKNSYILDKSTGKRKIEKLSQCETSSNLILEAALKKNDEEILLNIRGKDLVAIEMNYHSSCYKQYTRFITKPKLIVDDNEDYPDSFHVFCKETIEKIIIENKEIMRMNKLRDIFLKTVAEVEQTQVTSYKNYNLKRRLQVKYPQLCFIKQSKRNKCELVFCETLDTGVCHNISTSDSSKSTDSEPDNMSTNFSPVQADVLKTLFYSALTVKTAIENAPCLAGSWPLTAEELTFEAAEKMVPKELYNFLAWVIGVSDEPEIDKYVNVPDNIKRKLLSISQDIIYLASNGKKQTPKHLTLGMTVRHISGSSKLIGLLNGLGHSVSHSAVLQHDTDLALQQLRTESLVPQGFGKEVFTTLVWDNCDFGEETLSGAGTTHVTNGIILQWETKKNGDHVEVSPCLPFKKGRIKTMIPPTSIIVPYINVKRGPTNIKLIDESLEEKLISLQKPYRMLDDAFYLTKLCTSESSLPGWTGFNTQLSSTKSIPITKIGYLPVLDGNPSDISTVNSILLKSLEIADELQLPCIVLVMDEAIYSKAQQIRWNNDEFLKRIVLRLGDFHVAMSFLAILGKRFGDAGLQDVFIESQLVAENSISRVISGHHYNRCIRAHKIMAEALQNLRWQVFIDQFDHECPLYSDIIQNLTMSFKEQNFLNCLSDSNVDKIMNMYTDFVTKQCSGNPTFEFWSTYLEMVELLLLFQRATREGNWYLHLSAILSMMPWYFAYDRVNYSRYLPAYWMEMMNLEDTHPSVHNEFVRGKFVVQRQQTYGFALTACDQVIEQTFNRDSKTKGGLTGITLNKSAVHRWILSQHHRASISSQCDVLAGKESISRTRKELDESRIKQDALAVKNVIDTLSSFINPFSQQHEELLNIVSGVIVTDKIKDDVQEAYNHGKVALKKFISERFTSGTINLFTPIKYLKLLTFSDTGKTVISNIKSENISLKASRQLLTRLLFVAKVQNLDLQNLMKYSLNPLPIAISNYDGTIAKTNKAALFHFIEANENIHLLSKKDIPTGSALIIDGMSILQQLKLTQMTFDELSKKILKQIISFGKMIKCTRIDFVTDRYPSVNIKISEHTRRSCAGGQLVKIVNGSQLVPKQWKKFMSLGENKEALISYLFNTWKNYPVAEFEGITVFITHEDMCHSLCNVNGVLNVTHVENLTCDHVEADTRLLLHADHAKLTHQNIVLKCSDTDVLIITISLGFMIAANLFILKCSGQNSNVISIANIHEAFSKPVCKALIGLHVFTGCDSVSSFKGKGKLAAIKIMMASEEFLEAFIQLGSEWSVSDDLVRVLEKFICHLYGQVGCTSVDNCRYNWLRLGNQSDSTLPPNKDSLLQHILRANYQAAIHRRSLQSLIGAPTPLLHGWRMENGNLTVHWMTQNPIPNILLDQAMCKCKKNKCSTGHCSCKSSGIPCTELCVCLECANKGSDESQY